MLFRKYLHTKSIYNHENDFVLVLAHTISVVNKIKEINLTKFNMSTCSYSKLAYNIEIHTTGTVIDLCNWYETYIIRYVIFTGLIPD